MMERSGLVRKMDTLLALRASERSGSSSLHFVDIWVLIHDT